MKSVGRSLAVAAAAAASDGSGRGSARAAPSSRRRACCTAAWRKWLFWSFWPMLCAAWVFGFPVKDAFTSFSRAARSVADVAEAAGEVVEAGANATVQAAHAALEAVSTTTYVAEEIWRGVDLRRVEMHRSAVKVRGLDCGAIATWIENGGGGSVPTSLSSHLSKMIATVTESVPELQHHGDRFSVLGWFHTYQIRVRRRLDGSCVAAVLITTSSFDLEWMMPAWDVLGFDPDSGQTGHQAALFRPARVGAGANGVLDPRRPLCGLGHLAAVLGGRRGLGVGRLLLWHLAKSLPGGAASLVLCGACELPLPRSTCAGGAVCGGLHTGAGACFSRV